MPETSLLTAAESATHLLAAMDAGQKAAVFVVVAHPDPASLGGRILFRGTTRLGTLKDAEADSQVEELATAGLRGGTEVLPGLHTLSLETGEEATLYMELHHPPLELVIVGAGHLAQPLCTLGALLGMSVRVLDDRPEFATRERFPEAVEVSRVDFADPFSDKGLSPWSHVLLVTRGHRYDFECLRMVLQHDPFPGYVGMIGSRRRVRATFNALLEEGFPRELLSKVRAPIGLDLGSETPAEIAVSVAAEIVQIWRGGSGKALKDTESVLDRLCADVQTDPLVGSEEEETT